MIVSAHQVQYLPGLRMFWKMAMADTWIVFDDVPMESSGFENRNRILTPSGAQWLTVPVRRSQDTKLKDVEICTDQPWRRKHWRALEMAYSKAPQWHVHAQHLEDFYAQPWLQLADANRAVTTYMVRQFDIWPKQVVTLSSLGLTSTKSQLVLDAVLAVGGTHYIFGAKGRDYADLDAFARAGVTVSFQKYEPQEYPQMRPGFEPNLSALDLLMNMERKEAKEILMAGGSLEDA